MLCASAYHALKSMRVRVHESGQNGAALEMNHLARDFIFARESCDESVAIADQSEPALELLACVKKFGQESFAFIRWI